MQQKSWGNVLGKYMTDIVKKQFDLFIRKDNYNLGLRAYTVITMITLLLYCELRAICSFSTMMLCR
jgi:hypothetical protein